MKRWAIFRTETAWVLYVNGERRRGDRRAKARETGERRSYAGRAREWTFRLDRSRLAWCYPVRDAIRRVAKRAGEWWRATKAQGVAGGTGNAMW